MSISTYAELSAAVANWLHRADLTLVIPDFIDLGETVINRELRLRSMEYMATVYTTTTDRFATLPTGFAEAIDLALYSDDYPQILTQVPLSSINFRTVASGAKALPKFYSITSNIVFDIIPDAVYTCSLRYYKALDLATDLTNAVLTAYPDIYLQAALMQACLYVKDDQAADRWGGMLSSSIISANRKDARTKGKSMLVTSPGIRQRNNGDIMTGETW